MGTAMETVEIPLMEVISACNHNVPSFVCSLSTVALTHVVTSQFCGGANLETCNTLLCMRKQWWMPTLMDSEFLVSALCVDSERARVSLFTTLTLRCVNTVTSRRRMVFCMQGK